MSIKVNVSRRMEVFDNRFVESGRNPKVWSRRGDKDLSMLERTDNEGDTVDIWPQHTD